jgi:hypothetical protein
MYDPHTPCTPLPTCPHEPLIQCTCASCIPPGKRNLGQAPALTNPRFDSHHQHLENSHHNGEAICKYRLSDTLYS